MKRVFLLLGVAALGMCAASAANAKIVSISFDGLCDGFDIVVNRTAQIALETGNGCDEGANFGAGTIGKIRGTGRAITFAVNLSPKGGSAYQYVYVVSYPLVTGGTWSNFYTQDGKLVTKVVPAPTPSIMGRGTQQVEHEARRTGYADITVARVRDLKMQVSAYLDRIGVSQPVTTDLNGLRILHRAHLVGIPYENLDVQLGRPVTIELPPTYEKIVENHRGGWCYEMNGLFGWALRELGFDVSRGAGGVMREAMGDFSVGNHLVLHVRLPEGDYLADVGFGDGPIDPFRVAPGEFSDGRFQFALSQPDADWWRLHNRAAGGAKSFDFRLLPADEGLLSEKCRFLQASEASPFVQNLVCQRHTQDGITMLRGRVLRKVTSQTSEERLLENADDLLMTLKTEFDLDVPEAASLWPKILARHAALFGEGTAKPS